MPASGNDASTWQLAAPVDQDENEREHSKDDRACGRNDDPSDGALFPHRELQPESYKEDEQEW